MVVFACVNYGNLVQVSHWQGSVPRNNAAAAVAETFT